MLIAFRHIEIDHSLNHRQPFSVESCRSLADSLHKYGQDTPVVVEANPAGAPPYRLRVGFRRCTAAKDILGWDDIEARVAEFENEHEAHLANARENLERENLTYYEECCLLRNIFTDGTAIQKIADTLSRSTTWVRARWLLWTLPSEFVLGVEAGELTQTDVLRLIGRTYQDQLMIVQRIREGKEQGESQDEISTSLGKTKRPGKKQIQRMATVMLEQGRMAECNALLWAIGDMNDEQLIGEGTERGRQIPDRDEEYGG